MAKMRPKTTKMRLNIAKMRLQIAKMRVKMAKMRLKMAKMRAKMAKIRLIWHTSSLPHASSTLTNLANKEGGRWLRHCRLNPPALWARAC